MNTDNTSLSFLTRVAKITKKRILRSTYTQVFSALVVFTTILSIVLEGIIVSSHVRVYQELLDERMITGTPSTSVDPNQEYTITDPGILIALGLRRLKNENIFFILLSLFQLALGLDAIVRQSMIQVFAYTGIQILAVVFAAIQVGSTMVKTADVKKLTVTEDPEVAWNFNFALHNEIGLVSALTLFAFIFMYLSFKLRKEIGYSIYKINGADLDVNYYYQLTQIYFLNLRLDGFFHLVLCVFYLTVMTQEKYYALWGITTRKFVAYIIHIVLTLFLIPGLVFARHGVITENKSIMIVFLVTQVIIGMDFALVLVDSAGSWIFWIVAVCLAIVLCISTIVLSIMVSLNFNQGFKEKLQGTFTQKIVDQIDEKVEGEKDTSWDIESEDEDEKPFVAHPTI